MPVQTTDESLVPLLINCWPSASGGESYVNIEYESTTDFDLQNVAIAIPLPALAASPKVNQVNLVLSLAFVSCFCRATRLYTVIAAELVHSTHPFIPLILVCNATLHADHA